MCWWKWSHWYRISNVTCCRSHQTHSSGKLEMGNNLILVLLGITGVFGIGRLRRSHSPGPKESSCGCLVSCIQMKWKGKWKHMPYLHCPDYLCWQTRYFWTLQGFLVMPVHGECQCYDCVLVSHVFLVTWVAERHCFPENRYDFLCKLCQTLWDLHLISALALLPNSPECCGRCTYSNFCKLSQWVVN